MQAYQADTIHFQSLHQIQSITVFAWLKQRLQALRHKQAAKRDIAYFRTLDRHLLKDMGVDIAVLGENYPTLSSFVPPKGECKKFFQLPVNMSTR